MSSAANSLPMPPVEPPMPPGFTTLADKGRGRISWANAWPQAESPVREARPPQFGGVRKYASANVGTPMCSSCTIDVADAAGIHDTGRQGTRQDQLGQRV